MAAKVWRALKAIPSVVWWIGSVFFGALILGIKVTTMRWKVKDAKKVAKGRREALDVAAKDGSNEALRDELLKTLKEK